MRMCVTRPLKFSFSYIRITTTCSCVGICGGWACNCVEKCGAVIRNCMEMCSTTACVEIRGIANCNSMETCSHCLTTCHNWHEMRGSVVWVEIRELEMPPNCNSSAQRHGSSHWQVTYSYGTGMFHLKACVFSRVSIENKCPHLLT